MSQNSRTEMYFHKCDFCPYKTPLGDHLSRHITAVHEGVNSFKCAHCGYGAPERAQLEDHRAKYHIWNQAANKWTHKCHICSYTTTQWQHLRKHRSYRHTAIRDFVCEVCGHGARDRHDLEKHKEAVHEGIRDYKCEHCDYESYAKKSLVNHVRKSHCDVMTTVKKRREEFKCDECDYGSNKKHYLALHKTESHPVHSGIKDYKCEHCDYESYSKKYLVNHVRKNHCDITTVIKKRSEGFMCDECGYSCNEEELLNLHMAESHPECAGIKDYKCDHCDYVSYAKKSLVGHVRKNHSAMTTRGHFIIKKRSEQFKCDECDYSCNKEQFLNLHKAESHQVSKEMGDKDGNMEETMPILAKNVSFPKHTRTFIKHTRTSPRVTYSCGYCPFKNADRKGLLKHERQNHTHKDFRCDKCDHAFHSLETLEKHKAAMNHDRDSVTFFPRVSPQHSKGRQDMYKDFREYKCNKCGFTCHSIILLDRHKRAMKHKWDDGESDSPSSQQGSTDSIISKVSQNSKAIKCDQCSFTCSAKSDLDGHRHAVHYKTKHRCDRCDFACGNKAVLRKHFRKYCDGYKKKEPEISFFMCGKSLCFFSARSDHELAAHIADKHDLEILEEPTDQLVKVIAEDKEYQCDLCDFTCAGQDQLLDHVHYECMGEMEEGDVIEGHVKVELGDGPTDQSVQDKSIVDQSIEDQSQSRDSSISSKGKQVTTVDHMEAEMMQESMSLECNQCNVSFMSAPELHKHLFSHTGEKFTCNLCFKRLSSKLDLDCHQKKSHDFNKATSVMQGSSLSVTTGTSNFTDTEENVVINEVKNLPLVVDGKLKNGWEIEIASSEGVHDQPMTNEGQKDTELNQESESLECKQCKIFFGSAPELHRHLFWNLEPVDHHKNSHTSCGTQPIIENSVMPSTAEICNYSENKENIAGTEVMKLPSELSEKLSSVRGWLNKLRGD